MGKGCGLVTTGILTGNQSRIVKEGLFPPCIKVSVVDTACSIFCGEW